MAYIATTAVDLDLSARTVYGGCRTDARVLVHEVKLVVVVGIG
jgi:hypothetical protein